MMPARLLTAVHTGIHSLGTNPLRSVLSTLGVIIGVASLVAILSIGDSLERFSREQIEQTTDLQTIQVSSITVDVVDGVRVPRQAPVLLGPTDAVELASLLADDAEVTLLQTGSGWLTLEEDTSRHAVLVSAVLTSEDLPRSAEMLAGRFLMASDSVGEPVRAVVTASLAETTGMAADSLIGRTVRVVARDFEIVGVVGGPAASGSPRVLIPFSDDLRTTDGLSGRAPVAIVRAARVEDVRDLRQRVESWLETRFGSADRHFRVSTSRARVEQARQAMLVFKLALGAIAGISLLVGGIGIMNILLASVSERTREIGVRKAAGARHGDVLVQFLAESVLITGVGATIGIVVGMVGSYGVNAVIRGITDAPVKTTFTLWSILLAAVAAVLVGLVFGTYPARRAARLSASDAIRYE